MYFVWTKRRADADASWSRLPYAGRTQVDAFDLLEYYERAWGRLYSYQVLPSTLVPKGRVVCN